MTSFDSVSTLPSLRRCLLTFHLTLKKVFKMLIEKDHCFSSVRWMKSKELGFGWSYSVCDHIVECQFQRFFRIKFRLVSDP